MPPNNWRCPIFHPCVWNERPSLCSLFCLTAFRRDSKCNAAFECNVLRSIVTSVWHNVNLYSKEGSKVLIMEGVYGEKVKQFCSIGIKYSRCFMEAPWIVVIPFTCNTVDYFFLPSLKLLMGIYICNKSF